MVVLIYQLRNACFASQGPNRGNSDTPQHLDIDIVIKREPLPDHIKPEDLRELPTAAITLSRDQVKLTKLDSHSHRPFSPSEVITVWDTEIPVTDRRERVGLPIIIPGKLYDNFARYIIMFTHKS